MIFFPQKIFFPHDFRFSFPWESLFPRQIPGSVSNRDNMEWSPTSCTPGRYLTTCSFCLPWLELWGDTALCHSCANDSSARVQVVTFRFRVKVVQRTRQTLKSPDKYWKVQTNTEKSRQTLTSPDKHWQVQTLTSPDKDWQVQTKTEKSRQRLKSPDKDWKVQTKTEKSRQTLKSPDKHWQVQTNTDKPR